MPLQLLCQHSLFVGAAGRKQLQRFAKRLDGGDRRVCGETSLTAESGLLRRNLISVGRSGKDDLGLATVENCLIARIGNRARNGGDSGAHFVNAQGIADERYSHASQDHGDGKHNDEFEHREAASSARSNRCAFSDLRTADHS